MSTSHKQGEQAASARILSLVSVCVDILCGQCHFCMLCMCCLMACKGLPCTYSHFPCASLESGQSCILFEVCMDISIEKGSHG